MRRMLCLLALSSLTVFAGLAAGSSDAMALAIAGFDVERDLPALGVWGPLAIIGLRMLAALFGVVPSSPVLLAAGATEGILLGSVYVLTGAMLGAVIAFLIGRHLGRDFVARRGWMDSLAKTKFGGWLLDEQTSQTRLMAAVFYCRLIPGINLDALSYVAGVTPIATWRFCLATFGALLPYTVLLVAIGRQLVTLGATEFVIVLVAILAVSAIPVLWRYLHVRSARS
ncbi:MAG TPA: VTT domain-containing protein [Methyloceanibacter sp.]|nr:VTT domain-containing protein [Methyloceanibacter sp.]